MVNIPVRRLLRLWMAVGLQSFGGGASTQLLIRQVFVDREPLVADEDLAQMWNLCLLTPGINLVALTILIGWRLAGARGVVVSLAGLLVPSGLVTCLLTVAFATVQHSDAVRAIERGVVPASGGVMLLVGLAFARPQVRLARSEGWRSQLIGGALVLAATLCLIGGVPVAAVLAGAALAGVLFFTPRAAAPEGGSR